MSARTDGPRTFAEVLAADPRQSLGQASAAELLHWAQALADVLACCDLNVCAEKTANEVGYLLATLLDGVVAFDEVRRANAEAAT